MLDQIRSSMAEILTMSADLISSSLRISVHRDTECTDSLVAQVHRHIRDITRVAERDRP